MSDEGMESKPRRLHLIHPSDNVAMALEDLSAGTRVEVEREGRVQPISLLDPIPFGHKVALRDIAQGQPVMKYGEVIGLASKDIAEGQHVHVHNLESQRGRGDLRSKG